MVPVVVYNHEPIRRGPRDDVLANPTRRLILELLREREWTVGELGDRVGLSQPSVSHHLLTLHDRGLAVVRKDGNRHWYRASFAGGSAGSVDAVEHDVEEAVGRVRDRTLSTSGEPRAGRDGDRERTDDERRP
jgi:DNA-binding transcriptional ArsR family regulator